MLSSLPSGGQIQTQATQRAGKFDEIYLAFSTLLNYKLNSDSFGDRDLKRHCKCRLALGKELADF